MKLRKGDTVKVLSGNDKGKTGEILSVDVKNNKILVDKLCSGIYDYIEKDTISGIVKELEKKAESLHQNIQ